MKELRDISTLDESDRNESFSKLQGWTPLYLVTVLLKISFNLFDLSHNHGTVIT